MYCSSSDAFRPEYASTPAIYTSSGVERFMYPETKETFTHGQAKPSATPVSTGICSTYSETYQPRSFCPRPLYSTHQPVSDLDPFSLFQTDTHFNRPDAFSVRTMSRDQMQEVLDHAIQMGMTPSTPRVQDTQRAQASLKVKFSDEVSMPTFNGKGSWEEFISRFERLANLARWNEGMMLDRLLMSLVGEVSLFVDRLHPSELYDYFTLKRALEQRYKANHDPSIMLGGFQTRFRRAGETIRQYAHTLQNMIDTMFPNDHSPVKQSMLIGQFIRGLNNRECTEYLHLNVHIGRPDAWPEAIAKAEMFEHIKGAPFATNRTQPQTIPFQRDQVARVTEPRPQSHSFVPRQTENDRFRRDTQFSGRSTFDDVICYHCKGQGHMSRACPEKLKQSGNY